MAKGISRSFHYLIGYFCANLFVKLWVKPLSSSDNLFVLAVVVRFCFAQPETYGFLRGCLKHPLVIMNHFCILMQNDGGFY